MDKNTMRMLKLDAILALIEPAGDCGNHFKRHLSACKPGQESFATREYTRLAALLNAMEADTTLAEKLQNVLAHLAWLPQILKALEVRPLLLHEFFELKLFIHYVLQLDAILRTCHLQRLYPLPEFLSVYKLLDPDGQKTPAFHLSPLYDKKLARCLAAMQSLQKQKRLLETSLATEAQKALNLTSPRTEIVISRLQSSRIKQLDKTRFYRLTEENHANLTYRLLDTPSLKQINRRLAGLLTKLQTIEQSVRLRLSSRLVPYIARLSRAQAVVAMLDWDFAKARFAMKYNCVIPVLSRTPAIHINQAVNLPVRLSQGSSGSTYQPLDLHFTSKVNILTGPNMGGKTTALKTLGQMCTLASLVIPLPAQSARLCLLDSVWYNQDENEIESLSSFGQEVVNLSSILKKKGRLLLLLDELAKGTNPQEGEAILTAVLLFIKDMPGLCLAATHFDKPNSLKGVHKFAIRGIEEQQLQDWDKTIPLDLTDRIKAINKLMDYSLIQIKKNVSAPHNAITIASLLGLPQEIISAAAKLIK